MGLMPQNLYFLLGTCSIMIFDPIDLVTMHEYENRYSVFIHP